MSLPNVLIALSLHGAAAQASAAPAPVVSPAGAAPRCELHVWPAERLEGVAFSVYNGLIQGRASERQIEGAMDDLLSPSSQIAALRDADLAGGLGLPTGTRMVEHPEPLDRKTLNKIKTRRAPSSSPCYSELIIMQHGLVEDIVWGDRFISTFMFRDFAEGAQAGRVFKGSGGNKLKVLTQAEASRPADAPQLVADALRANFREYAKNARAKMAGRSGGPRR